MRYFLILFLALALGSCDLFDGPPYVTTLEGIAVDADTGQPLADIGVGFAPAVGNGVSRPFYVVDVTGADGRFFVADTVNISDPDFRSYEVFPFDDRQPDVYVYPRSTEPAIFLDQGDRREMVIPMRRIPQ